MLESLGTLENLVHRNTMIGVLCSQKYYLFNFVNSYYEIYGEWFLYYSPILMEKYILTISGWRLLSCRWDVVELDE